MTLEEVQKWSDAELSNDIAKGGKFVIYTYVFSCIIMTFKRPSKIYYIPSNKYAISNGYPYLLLSLILGWWGIPWGPIYTIQSIWYGFVGKDVTSEIMETNT